MRNNTKVVEVWRRNVCGEVQQTIVKHIVRDNVHYVNIMNGSGPPDIAQFDTQDQAHTRLNECRDLLIDKGMTRFR